jgi:hypothetical protein
VLLTLDHEGVETRRDPQNRRSHRTPEQCPRSRISPSSNGSSWTSRRRWDQWNPNRSPGATASNRSSTQSVVIVIFPVWLQELVRRVATVAMEIRELEERRDLSNRCDGLQPRLGSGDDLFATTGLSERVLLGDRGSREVRCGSLQGRVLGRPGRSTASSRSSIARLCPGGQRCLAVEDPPRLFSYISQKLVWTVLISHDVIVECIFATTTTRAGLSTTPLAQQMLFLPVLVEHDVRGRLSRARAHA